MADASPLMPSPAPVAVQEAFDRYHAELVGELTAICGSAGAAEAAVDEAFRRAAALPDFAEIGRPLDWLRVTARNQVVRRSFRRDDLDGSRGLPAAASFERPSLSGSLSRAARAHRRHMARRVGLGAAGTVLAFVALFAATSVSPWAPTSALPTTSPTPSRVRSSPPLIPTHAIPSPSTSAPEPWPPVTPQAVVGHPDARQAYVVTSPQVASRRAIVWQRCRPGSGSSPTCDQENAALAVEVVDGKGHRLTHLLQSEQVVRPAFAGNFAIIAAWAGDDYALISPTMKEPQPFEVKTGARPRPGQQFSTCASGPCLVDLHGTVHALDLPGDVQWDSNTTKGWVGTQHLDNSSGSARVFIQQDDETFATVDVTVKSPSEDGALPYAANGQDGSVAVWFSSQSGFAQVAVSTDRGRSWTIHWANPADGWSASSYTSLPVAGPPGMTVTALKKRPPGR